MAPHFAQLAETSPIVGLCAVSFKSQAARFCINQGFHLQRCWVWPSCCEIVVTGKRLSQYDSLRHCRLDGFITRFTHCLFYIIDSGCWIGLFICDYAIFKHLSQIDNLLYCPPWHLLNSISDGLSCLVLIYPAITAWQFALLLSYRRLHFSTSFRFNFLFQP